VILSFQGDEDSSRGRVSTVVHLNFTLKMEVRWSFETMIFYHITRRRHNLDDCNLTLKSCIFF